LVQSICLIIRTTRSTPGTASGTVIIRDKILTRAHQCVLCVCVCVLVFTCLVLGGVSGRYYY
jgi:hypothetical protein